jgi:hypothetical protein
VYTEVLAEMSAHLGQISQHTAQTADHTARMTGDLTAIRLQNDLDRLEREWQQEKLRRTKAYKSDGREIPSQEQLITQGVLIAVLGVVGLVLLLTGPGFQIILGGLLLVFACIKLVDLVVAKSHAHDYDKAQAMYERKKSELLRRLQENERR